MIQEVLPNIPRLWTATAEWGACLVYVLASWRAGGPVRRAVVVLAVAWPALMGYHLLIEHLPIWMWLGSMLGAVTGMWATIALALRQPARGATYLVVRAFVVAELVASLEWQLEMFFLQPAGQVQGAFFLLLFDSAALAAVYLLERRQFQAHLSPAALDVLASVAIAGMTFALSNLSFLSTSTPFSGRLSREIFYIRTLVDLCGFVVLYAQRETARQTRAARELAASQAMLTSQYEQYLASKRATDVVNHKYHDLRNLITAIRAETDPSTRLDQLDELEDSVRTYGAFVRTGSPVLDVILTDKGQVCSEEGIALRIIADGASLGFVSAINLATILGNGLDNAIEAVRLVPDQTLRTIRLDIRTHHSFVVIEIENTVGAAPRRESRP